MQDFGRAALLFEKLCDDGLTLACGSLAYMVEHGQGLAKDRERAKALYRKACVAGMPLACDKLRSSDP